MLHFALLWLFVGLQGIPAPEGVKVAEERLVLKTPAGVIVIALYPEVAPQSVTQMLKLAREGIFDGICIPRIAPGFLLQFSAAELDRQPVLPASLRTLIRPLPAEFSKLKHVRGMVNLGRLDEDVNSATT
ncbi:MAG TPA: peptidylprolyl isomerase, partial [Gemmatales bacterium]|nr:peptidylprolyl isomerase [Gemmatales bacterium]